MGDVSSFLTTARLGLRAAQAVPSLWWGPGPQGLTLSRGGLCARHTTPDPRPLSAISPDPHMSSWSRRSAVSFDRRRNRGSGKPKQPLARDSGEGCGVENSGFRMKDLRLPGCVPLEMPP